MIRDLVILIAFGMVSTIWASEAVAVQVISAVYEKSITHEFDAKLKKSGLPIQKKFENGRYVVMLGNFKDAASAKNALKKARLVVSSDAFIRPVDRKYDTVVKSGIKSETHEVASGHKEVVSAAATHSNAIVVQPAAITATVTPVVAAAAHTIDTKAESKTSVPMVVLECDKKEMRKDEIAEAIAYYKNSPYHRFQPVGLQR